MHRRIVPESELRPATCEMCGSHNILDGEKKNCPDCIAWLEEILEHTGIDLRKEGK